MTDLVTGYRRYRREVFAGQAARSEQLAGGQRPGALFIGCSDSRVVPELITHSEPGELFVIRTAGNLVPVHGAGPDGVAASIEYAVGVLGVADVVVCGHSGCGAMTALAQPGQHLDGLPSVAAWLRHADAAVARGAGSDVEALVRDNVLAQLDSLRTHPAVVRALATGAVTLHGWVYDIRSGSLEVFEPTENRFAPLSY